MVSPNDHVVMNHEDQTRTNDVWGHVRYTNKPNEQGEYLNLGNTGEGILKKNQVHKFAVGRNRFWAFCYNHASTPLMN
jgi:hypothetical protein